MKEIGLFKATFLAIGLRPLFIGKREGFVLPESNYGDYIIYKHDIPFLFYSFLSSEEEFTNEFIKKYELKPYLFLKVALEQYDGNLTLKPLKKMLILSIKEEQKATMFKLDIFNLSDYLKTLDSKKIEKLINKSK